jgi:mRNA interferase RelE/StbE
MAYRIAYTARAAQQIRKLDRQISKRVIAALEKLIENPRRSGATQLRGHDLYRVRIGDYRAIYKIDDDEQLVEVAVVAHRRDVYRDL